MQAEIGVARRGRARIETTQARPPATEQKSRAAGARGLKQGHPGDEERRNLVARRGRARIETTMQQGQSFNIVSRAPRARAD